MMNTLAGDIVPAGVIIIGRIESSRSAAVMTAI
jgi:hypothetical protein